MDHQAHEINDVAPSSLSHLISQKNVVDQVAVDGQGVDALGQGACGEGQHHHRGA